MEPTEKNNLKVVDLDPTRFSDPKRFLEDLIARLDHDFPKVEQICVVLGYEATPDEMSYNTTSNHLKRNEKLWLLEMGRKCLIGA